MFGQVNYYEDLCGRLIYSQRVETVESPYLVKWDGENPQAMYDLLDSQVQRIYENDNGRWTTTLHQAAMIGDVAKIERLLAAGCDVNLPNSEGQTAVVQALLSYELEAAQLLLSRDGGEVLWKPAPSVTLAEPKQWQSTLQREDQLEDFPVDQLLLINDVELLGQKLNRLTSISLQESELLMKNALELNNPEQVQLLLKCGPGSVDRRKLFFDLVTQDLDDPKTRPYFDQLVNWEVIDRDMLSPSVWSLRCERQDLYHALLDIGIAQYARRKFSVELTTRQFSSTFENSVWRKRQFDVNGLDLLGFGALHWACIKQNNGAIVYLLDNGANPNLQGRCGRSPLFYASNEKAVQLLVEGGADVQLADDTGCSLLESKHYSEYVGGHAGILAEKGLLRNQWKFCGDYSVITLRSRMDFERMMNVRVSESGATLYSILFNSADEIACYVKDEKTVAAIMKASSTCVIRIKSYTTMLEKNLKDALEVHQLRPIAADFLGGVMGIADHNHLVLEQIVSYLTYKDLLAIRKLERLISSIN